MNPYIKQFKDISIADIAVVGGKNSSLGEMFSKLSSKGIPVPDGFASTTFAFEEFLTQNSLQSRLNDLMLQIDKKDYLNLKETGAKARKLLLDAELPQNLQAAVMDAYKELCGDTYFEVAVRSSATA